MLVIKDMNAFLDFLKPYKKGKILQSKGRGRTVNV